MKEGSAYVWLAAHVASSCYKWAQDEPYALSFFSFYQHTNVPAWLEDSPASCSEYFSLLLDAQRQAITMQLLKHPVTLQKQGLLHLFVANPALVPHTVLRGNGKKMLINRRIKSQSTLWRLNVRLARRQGERFLAARPVPPIPTCNADWSPPVFYWTRNCRRTPWLKWEIWVSFLYVPQPNMKHQVWYCWLSLSGLHSFCNGTIIIRAGWEILFS